MEQNGRKCTWLSGHAAASMIKYFGQVGKQRMGSSTSMHRTGCPKAHALSLFNDREVDQQTKIFWRRQTMGCSVFAFAASRWPRAGEARWMTRSAEALRCPPCPKRTVSRVNHPVLTVFQLHHCASPVLP